MMADQEKLTPAQQLRAVQRKVSDLQQRKFYGQVTLEFMHGNIVLTRMYETEKLKLEAENATPDREARPHAVQDQEASAKSEHEDQEAQASQ